jgi:branched-subunit amino acid ABC-type transport system permease component
LFLILLGLLGGFWYIFSKTMLGIILKGMFEHSNVIRWLGVPTMKILQWLFGFFLLLLLANSFLILNETNLRASDGLFYLIKGIGIMILVGVAKKEYMYLGALLYVFIEYLLFIQFWFPISYKETLIIAVIVLVLLAKPEWLFSLAKRRV